MNQTNLKFVQDVQDRIRKLLDPFEKMQALEQETIELLEGKDTLTESQDEKLESAQTNVAQLAEAIDYLEEADKALDGLCE